MRPLRALPLLALPASILAGAVPAHAVTAARPARAAAAAARVLERTLGTEAVVSLDPATGRPRVVARLDGYLTGPSQRDPAAIVRGFVRDHADLYGVGGA